MQRRNTSQSKEFMTFWGFDLPQITVQLEKWRWKTEMLEKKKSKAQGFKPSLERLTKCRAKQRYFWWSGLPFSFSLVCVLIRFIGLFQCLFFSVSDNLVMPDEIIDENVLFVCLCSARLLYSSEKLIFIQSVNYTKWKHVVGWLFTMGTPVGSSYMFGQMVSKVQLR